MKRRDFISHSSAIAAGALILPNSLFSFGESAKNKLRLGFIAVGFRGQTHIAEMLKRNDIEIVAIADPDKKMVESAQKLIEKSTGKAEKITITNDKGRLSQEEIDRMVNGDKRQFMKMADTAFKLAR